MQSSVRCWCSLQMVTSVPICLWHQRSRNYPGLTCVSCKAGEVKTVCCNENLFWCTVLKSALNSISANFIFIQLLIFIQRWFLTFDVRDKASLKLVFQKSWHFFQTFHITLSLLRSYFLFCCFTFVFALHLAWVDDIRILLTKNA